MKLIKIGDQWYAIETVDGKTSLVVQPTPETEPDTFIDGDALLAETDGLELVDFRAKVLEAQTAFTEAREKATKSGAPDDIAAMREAQTAFVVLNSTLTDRASAIAEAAGEIEIPEIEAATPPNEMQPKPGEAEEGGEGSEGGTGTGTGEPGEGGEQTGDGEGGSTEGGEGALSPDVAELVTASAHAAVAAIQASGAQNRQAPMVVPKGGIRLDALTDGGVDGESGQQAPKARMIAATGQQVVSVGEEMTDEQFLQAFRDFEKQYNGVGLDGLQAAASMGNLPRNQVAKFHVYDAEDSPTMVAHDAPEAFRAVRAAGQMIGGHHPTIHADGSSCDNCVTQPDVRREIPDTMLDEDPLGMVLATYPAPHCELEYYKALSLADIDAGITVWDDAAKTAFCNARDAWYAALRTQQGGGAAADPALYAAMKAAEKDCAIPSCAPTDNVKPIGLSVCLEYPIEMEHCNPELIPVYRAALHRRFIQRKNQRILGQMEEYNIPVTVDVEEVGGSFVNADGDNLGAAPVILHVLKSLLARGVMTERIEGGNYSLMLPFSMVQMLAVDEGKTEDKTLRAISDYLEMPVTTLYEYTDGDQSAGQVLAGQGGPFVFNSLPPVVKDGGTPVPYGANLDWPTDWKIYLQDLSDFFMVTRPEVTVGAQVTPDSARQNMVFGMFEETFFGVGKDGNHPSWTIDFSNLRPNGARVAGIRPVS